MESLQGERSIFYARLCKKATKKAHQALIMAFLQPATTAAMHCHPEGCTHPLCFQLIPIILTIVSLATLAFTDHCQSSYPCTHWQTSQWHRKGYLVVGGGGEGGGGGKVLVVYRVQSEGQNFIKPCPLISRL